VKTGGVPGVVKTGGDPGGVKTGGVPGLIVPLTEGRGGLEMPVVSKVVEPGQVVVVLVYGMVTIGVVSVSVFVVVDVLV